MKWKQEIKENSRPSSVEMMLKSKQGDYKKIMSSTKYGERKTDASKRHTT
jgi:hypothetical protein